MVRFARDAREAMMTANILDRTQRWRARTIATLLAAGFALAGVNGASAAAPLRVCSVPDNMPFSNERGEVFENKLAELIADRLDTQLEYVWFPEATGYVPT